MLACWQHVRVYKGEEGAGYVKRNSRDMFTKQSCPVEGSSSWKGALVGHK